MGKKVVASHVTDVIFVCDISMVKYFTLLIGSLQVCFFFLFSCFFFVFFFVFFSLNHLVLFLSNFCFADI